MILLPHYKTLLTNVCKDYSYSNPEHPNSSNETLHLKSFRTNNHRNRYNPLMEDKRARSTQTSLFMGVNWCMICEESCAFIYNGLFHLHTCTAEEKSAHCVLSAYWTLRMNQVISWQVQIPVVRYNQFHLHLPCLLLHFFLAIVIGMNGLSVLITRITSSSRCRKNKKRSHLNAFTQR